MTVTVRPFEEADVHYAAGLLNDEGWAFDVPEIERLLRVAVGLVAEENGRRLGVLTEVIYPESAWIGNVVVPPEARGRGVGGHLVEAALALARERGVPTVGLYSVLPAITLYARSGFVPTGTVHSYHGRASPADRSRSPHVHALTPAGLDEVARFDARYFGDDRSQLLAVLTNAFPDTSFVYTRSGETRGYAIAKPGARASEIGPLVVHPGDAQAAGDLLDTALAVLPDGPVELAIPEVNAVARDLALARGFKRAFEARTMYRGRPLRKPTEQAMVALGGLEKG